LLHRADQGQSQGQRTAHDQAGGGGGGEGQAQPDTGTRIDRVALAAILGGLTQPEGGFPGPGRGRGRGSRTGGRGGPSAAAAVSSEGGGGGGGGSDVWGEQCSTKTHTPIRRAKQHTAQPVADYLTTLLWTATMRLHAKGSARLSAPFVPELLRHVTDGTAAVTAAATACVRSATKPPVPHACAVAMLPASAARLVAALLQPLFAETSPLGRYSEAERCEKCKAARGTLRTLEGLRAAETRVRSAAVALDAKVAAAPPAAASESVRAAAVLALSSPANVRCVGWEVVRCVCGVRRRSSCVDPWTAGKQSKYCPLRYNVGLLAHVTTRCLPLCAWPNVAKKQAKKEKKENKEKQGEHTKWAPLLKSATVSCTAPLSHDNSLIFVLFLFCKFAIIWLF
jgi:hypothetical protein